MTVRKSQTQTIKFIFNETRCIVSATPAKQSKAKQKKKKKARQTVEGSIFNEVLTRILLELLAYTSRTPAK